MRVDIYRNLHKKQFSVRDCSTRLVVDHLNWVIILNASFHVGEKGRQRVIREKRKNVHAVVRGTISRTAFFTTAPRFTQVTYNPYKFGYFYQVNTLEPVHTAPFVLCNNGRIYIPNN